MARCPAGTEPLAARLRLSHLLGGADPTPRGFPPHAVLVIRRATAGRGLTLGAHVSRAALEREVREQVSALWRRAARPVGGRVSESAEAVLFADEGEWLAALALALARGEAGRHWCWRYTRGAAAGVPPSQALVRAWGESARFVPAAAVRLAHWGEAARVLGALQPAEAGALLSALRSEFGLPPPPDAPGSSVACGAAVKSDRGAERGVRRGAVNGSTEETPGAQSPPWSRWLPSDGGECARLHAASRTLLAFAAALFHAPALARSHAFAAEVSAFNERFDARARTSPAEGGAGANRPTRTRARGAYDDNEDGRARDTYARHAEPDAVHDGSHQAAHAPEEARRSGEGERKGTAEERSKARPAGGAGENATHGAGASSEVADASAEGFEAEAQAAPWGALGGCETRLGGALFLLNLLAGLRLPECFDEDYALSDHITGWGLTELLARALLGKTFAEFEADPLWGALAQLDGRAAGEPPAQGLRVGTTYRAPARWLRLFAPRDAVDVWAYADDGGRLVVTHAAGFHVALLPLEGRGAPEAAARLADVYRAQGLRVSLHARGGSPTASEAAGGDGLRRWMSWTFPFLRYALRRSLADAGGELEGDGAARELLVRRGRLYCTATHVDLVLKAASVSFEARRAGLDASPGWVRDLMRVVAFHFE